MATFSPGDPLRASDAPLRAVTNGKDSSAYRHHRPGDHALVSGEGKPKVQVVVGGTGFDASTIAGTVAGVREQVDPIKWWVASGGGITALPALLGLSPEDYRMTNYGAPTDEAMMPLGDSVKGGFVTRKGLDLSGTRSIEHLADWLTEVAASAGVNSWNDLLYKDGESRPMGEFSKLSVGLVMWSPGVAQNDPATGKPRIYTDAELRDPSIVKAEDSRYMFTKHGPINNVEQVWFPDDVVLRPDLAFLKDKVMAESPGQTVADSCRQLPVCVKRMEQNKETGQLYFFADGAHLEMQAMRGNDGHVLSGVASKPRGEIMNVPVINLRMAKTTYLPADRARHQTGANMPLAEVINIKAKKLGLREGFKLTAQDRDNMYLTGLRLARTLIPNVVKTMGTNLEDKLVAIRDRNSVKQSALIEGNYTKTLESVKEHFGEESPQYAEAKEAGKDYGDLEHDVAVGRFQMFRLVMGAPEPDRNLVQDLGITS